ncbi:ABC transporter substrate-binding protein [Pseudoalteromonas sp. SWN29]|uniref:ABC transporter substrate-binding protein n=1 Tax=Pseudoalteromonas sp. SWN29 TaxID=2792064 RepID=UPI0018CE6264|nr:ABC transporter substrate-binding protein [Pseudoalteromonas sp. SWN29]MBH0027845.1 ABC transporter substrate-binding protein [Pseudoalteromonas sp. SWN29]
MKAYQLFLLFVLTLFTQPSLSKTVNINILVEDGYFPIIIDAQKQQGLAPEFIKILNDSQIEFNFILNSLPVKRLSKSVEQGHFDVLFLMALQWIPQSVRSNVMQSSFYMITKNELYALKENAKNQDYFNDLRALTKVGVLGYSYHFAGYNTDAYYLSEEHGVSLTIDEYNVVKMLLLKRANIGVLNSIAYQYFKDQKAFDMSLLYKSEIPDAAFDTHFLVNTKQNKISASKIDAILNSSVIQPQIKNLLDKYGVSSSFSIE